MGQCNSKEKAGGEFSKRRRNTVYSQKTEGFRFEKFVTQSDNRMSCLKSCPLM